MNSDPTKGAIRLVIYLSVTLLGPLALAILPPAEGAWWILKVIGVLLALVFVGTFFSKTEFHYNLLGHAYAGFIAVIVLYTIALFLKHSVYSLIFYALALFQYLGLVPSIAKHIEEQRKQKSEAIAEDLPPEKQG